jgi:hypothetical protein
VGNVACRNSYVQAIMHLLRLQSGVSLFREIIIAHHCMPGLPKVNFTLVQGKGSRFQWYDYPGKCQINLEWDGVHNSHKNDTWVLAVNNRVISKQKLISIKVRYSEITRLFRNTREISK